jgi:choline dehydrogenase
VVDAPGVGANLQDRYEVGVIGEMSSVFGDQFTTLAPCTFNSKATPAELDKTDPCWTLWKHNLGIYTINGNAIGVVKRSSQTTGDPDLFLFGLPGYFRGYYPGYSEEAVGGNRRYFTWVVLKAHSRNNGGRVRLVSPDPRVRPEVRFHSFQEGGDADLQALVDGVNFARRIVDKAQRISPFFDSFREVYPGVELQGPQLSRFIKDKSWGHHACCTAKIGAASDPMAVLDGRFRVRGTDGLRVVDASAFPKIPGFFPAVPIYMMSEKAADVIQQDAAPTH